jgi:hypothetical protein
MLLFDRALTVIEKFMPSWLPVFNKARIFLFPGRAQDVLSDTLSDEEAHTLRDNFFLPFPTTVVEDALGFVLLMDLEKDQRGLSGQRRYIECMPTTAASMRASREFDEGDFSEDEIKALVNDMPHGTLLFNFGRIGPLTVFNKEDNPVHQFLVEGDPEGYIVATPDRIIATSETQPSGVDFRAAGEAGLRNANVCMQEIFYFNAPDRFILEETDLKAKPVRSIKRKVNGKKVRMTPSPRSNQRPVYTLLKPKEIRKRLGLPEDIGGVKRPHERRRHFRTYPQDEARWPKAHGKTIIVPATWIGPSEAEFGGKRYRVLLDR